MIDEVFTRRAPKGGATSWNADARTFRAVIAAGAGVERRDWDGPYTEFLDPAGVELPAAVPLLNAHRANDVRDVVGAVEKVERVGDRLEAVLKLSGRADVEGIAKDIQDGVITGISAGYSVTDWTETSADDGTRRTKTATRWRLLEVSIVPIPADDAARIRGKAMTNTTDEPIETPTPRRATRAASETEIRAFAQQIKLPDEFVNEQIARGVSMRAVREAAIDYLAETQEREQPRVGIRAIGAASHVGDTSIAQRSTALAGALASRLDHRIEPVGEARAFVGLSLPDLAREHLHGLNIDTRAWSKSRLVDEALGARSMGGLHTTSDFSFVLSSAIGTVLRRAYEAAPSGLKPLARRVELDDFRARTFASMSGFSALERVPEHGEFKRGTISDAGESVRLETFGKIFGITRQAIVNDDLGAFADMPRRFGIAAAQFEAEQLAALLARNPTMADGKALFHADHGNLDTAAALGKAALSAARVAMRSQRDSAGQIISIVPRWLIVGPQLETTAEELMATIAPSGTDDVQPIRLKIAVEPRLVGREWYVAADPAEADGLVCAYLASEPGPQIERQVGFNVDGVEMKIRLDFGCAFIDWRSWHRNPGAPIGP